MPLKIKYIIYSTITTILFFLFIEILLREVGFSISIENESLYDSVLGDYKPNQDLMGLYHNIVNLKNIITS